MTAPISPTRPADEAAAILIRLFNTLAYGMGKRLKPEHEAEIRRACELLSADGALAPLDDLPTIPRMSPAEAAANFIPAEQVDPQYREWKQTRARAERDER